MKFSIKLNIFTNSLKGFQGAAFTARAMTQANTTKKILKIFILLSVLHFLTLRSFNDQFFMVVNWLR